MVDSNFANSANSTVQWPRHATSPARPASNTSFSRFCWGTALGVVIGGFAGAFLPDRLVSAGAYGRADFDPAPASNLTRQNRTPTPVSQLSDIQATAQEPHTWDFD
jgi:hypothetical protein